MHISQKPCRISSPSISFPSPSRGASLLITFRAQRQSILIVGSGLLAASRAFAALEADFSVTILARGGTSDACAEVKWRAEKGQYVVLDWDRLPGSSAPYDQQDIENLNSLLSTDNSIALACITDTIIGPHRRTRASAEQLYRVFKAHKVPVNTTDMPDLCDFSFMSTCRFEDSRTGERTPLQVGVTTNGQGCRLAGRIRREIVSKLSKDIGSATCKVGRLRAMAKKSVETLDEDPDSAGVDVASDEVNEDSGLSTPNRPVPQRGRSETALESARRRMKWVAQVSEYWPISKLAAMSDEEMNQILIGENTDIVEPRQYPYPTDSRHELPISRTGSIFLVGSGPGHPSLITLATHTALTELADIVLSDKLVPDAVLALIPKRVQVRIAKKFPGNAEGAQQEMMEAAVDAAKQGLTVVRLKQGDPVVYGRAGEEVLYFRSHGFEPLIIPGVSSALAAPTFAGIPVTQRGVAESFTVCTGVGRKGKDIQLPGYERTRTLIVLMGVARLPQVVQALTDANEKAKRAGAAYPKPTPIAIIERASMPDQRILMSTLENIVEALANCGDQRPPGMMIIGWSVLALWGQGDVEVLNENSDWEDGERIKRWLGDLTWRVQEGLDSSWEIFQRYDNPANN